VFQNPTSFLNPVVRVGDQIAEIFELNPELGLTYVLISHNLIVTRSMSDDVAVMYLGKIVEMAPSAELFARPLHPYSSALISAIPAPDPATRRVIALAKGDVPSPVQLPTGCRYHPRCLYAEVVCREVEPPLVEQASGHRAACHFPGIAGREAPDAAAGRSDP